MRPDEKVPQALGGAGFWPPPTVVRLTSSVK
jgi:hypothetical protein